MHRDSLHWLFSRDALLAIGVTFFVLGIILRGLARDHRRTVARRKQHELETKPLREPTEAASHFERHFNRYATVVMVSGAALAIVAFLR